MICLLKKRLLQLRRLTSLMRWNSGRYLVDTQNRRLKKLEQVMK